MISNYIGTYNIISNQFRVIQWRSFSISLKRQHPLLYCPRFSSLILFNPLQCSLQAFLLRLISNYLCLEGKKKRRRKKMRVVNMLLKVRAVAVFFCFLMSIIPAHEAIRVPYGEKQILMSQKALFVTDHNVDVSPLTRSLLSRGDVPPSAPNPPSWTPSKSHRAPPSLGP